MESVGGKPGGGINIWRALFPAPFVLEIYSFEFGAACAQQWEREHPGVVARVIIGDQNSTEDLDRAYVEAGNEPFDVIVDDGSHVSEHQYYAQARAAPLVAQ